MTVYTIIAYRPNGDDYCRGCHMGSTDSNFEMMSSINMEDIITLSARLQDERIVSDDRALSNYEIIYLINGRDPHGGWGGCPWDSYGGDEDSLADSDLNEIEYIKAAVKRNLDDFKQARIDAEKKAKEEAAAALKLKQKQAIVDREAKERAEYERLKVKYET